MLPPVVFEPLHREVTGVAGQLRVLLASIGENFDVISSPNKNHEERAADLLIWAHAGGPPRFERLFVALIGEFGERSPVGEAIAGCRAHLGRIASITAAVTLRRIEGHVFADREDLRKYVLAEFSSVEHPYRVVVVDGKERTGKTHLWHFIRYAARSLSADPVLIDLEDDQRISAFTMFERIVDEASRKTPVERTVDPTATPEQQARSLVARLVGWHKRGELHHEKPLWIVIDHLDKIWPPADPGLTPFIQHLILACAKRKAEGLRLILLGVPPEAIGGLLEAEIERRFVDPLTPGDLTEWLRDELLDLCLAMDRLDREARLIHGNGPFLLDKRLAACCRELRSEQGCLR